MRVYLDETNKKNYQEIFEALGQDVGTTIEDLPGYYNALKTLGTSAKYKYYRIPLEEGYFTVNLTSRAITVPSVFTKNGIAIKGDANAELVFFETDRFFDTVDLYSDNLICYIQWQNTGSKKSGNSLGILRDATENKCYFGWLITEDMVNAVGNLEFALRWYQVTEEDGEKKLVYSLGTQKASCAVRAGLDVDLSKEADNLESLVMSRPYYSGVINSLEGVAPYIETTLEEQVVYFEDSDSASFTVSAKAASNSETETGELTFVWYRNGVQVENDENITIISGDTDTGCKSSTLTTKIAGKYQVQIGNTLKSSGTRYVPSGVITVPAAEEIKASKMFGTQVVSDGSALEIAVVNAKTEKEVDSHSTLSYAWTLDNAAIADANNSSYTPTAGTEGVVNCVVTCALNGTSTELKSNECELHALPNLNVAPTLTREDNTIVAAFEAGTVSHEDEITYVWYLGKTAGSISTQSNYGNTKTLDISSLKAGETYSVYCIATQSFSWGGKEYASNPQVANTLVFEK